MKHNFFDVVVIGAGIHGAGVAQAVASSGRSVLVLEQNDVASGTSCRSSKLIHGGLRYLETGQFKLVRECLQERTLLINNAPEIVKLVPFYIPVYAHTSRASWKIRTGLSLYAVLGGLHRENRYNVVAENQWPQLNGLNTKNLKKVYQYWDGQTDDQALTFSVMASATGLGATLLKPARFLSAQIQQNDCSISYQYQSSTLNAHCKVIVNASGPWVNLILNGITPEQKQPHIDLVQGTHIVIQDHAPEGIFYLQSPQDGRGVFVMPWKNNRLIGTTETIFHGDPSTVEPLDCEINYLLDTYSHYFASRLPQLKNQIIEKYAGLRVLPANSTSAFGKSRETIIALDNPHHPRLVSIVGGKLTAYRLTAEKVMQKIKTTLKISSHEFDTRSIKLHGIKNI